MSGASIVDALLLAVQGRLSLQIVIAASLILAGIVFFLVLYMILFGIYHRLVELYRHGRRKLYEPAIERLLMEEPFEAVLSALKPKRWGDVAIAQEVIIDAMRYLKGPPFDCLRLASYRLGLVERNLRLLRASRKHSRGKAMEALGVMRVSEAVVMLIDVLEHEPMDMKLVALRSLAAIGDPATLPYFVKTAADLSPAMLVRLASLMLEFGRPSWPYIQELINQHGSSFPPRVLRELLEILAVDSEPGAA